MGKRILCIEIQIPGDIYQAVGNDMKKCALDGKACTDAWGKL